MEREQVNILYALDTFSTLRERLLNRTLNKESGLFCGLHSIEKTLSRTYIDRNRVAWLLEHFEFYKEILDRNISPDDIEYKRECVEYFAGIFKEFLKLNSRSFLDSDITIGILKELESELDSMIYFSENWENRYDQLCVLIAKNEEKYKKLKRKMMEV